MGDYEELDAEAWRALGTGWSIGGAARALDALAAGLGATSDDLVATYAPLAQVVDERRRTRSPARGAFLVGVTGGVASGKSSAAAVLAVLLAGAEATRVEVVSTDGFLSTNAELAAAGLTDRKGFPESYDETALLAFLDAARAGESALEVPVYDHVSYDVHPQRRVLDAADVIVIEGVNVLQSLPASGIDLSTRLDFSVYVEVAEAILRDWFVARMVHLRSVPSDGPSFYDGFAGLSDEEFRGVAEAVWDTVNRPNLLDHIEPTRERADLVLEQAPDHSVRRVRLGRA